AGPAPVGFGSLAPRLAQFIPAVPPHAAEPAGNTMRTTMGREPRICLPVTRREGTWQARLAPAASRMVRATPRMPPRQPSFEHFDPSIAEGFLRASRAATGLHAYLGIRIVELAPGRLVAAMDVREELLTPFGALHGGVMAGLVDHALGCVLYPLMERGQWAATTEFKLNYLAPVRAGTVVAESTVVALGRRTAVVR